MGVIAGRAGLGAHRGFSRSPYALTVLRFDAGEWRTVLEVEERLIYPHVQLQPWGDVVVVGTHSRRDAPGQAELNAAVYLSSGELLRRFLVGDGVEDVQATGTGDLCVSYFDQGTIGDFGRLGWGRLSPEKWIDPVGMSGLVRFDSLGNLRREFVPPGGFKMINDTYALNCWNEDAWTSYHPDFPIVRVSADGTTTGWTTGLGLVCAFAVCEERILLYWSNGSSRPGCLVGRLGPKAVTNSVQTDLLLSDGEALTSLFWVKGKGAMLNAFSGTSWYRLNVAEL